MREAPGCKFAKHESKEEEDEEEEDLHGNDLKESTKRCLCCKELGHTIDQCPRDPNIRTRIDTEDEYERVVRIKDYRKLNADTVVTTTHFLKKCIIVPNKQTDNEEKSF